MTKLEQYRAYVEQVNMAHLNHTLTPQAYLDLLNSIDWFAVVEELLPIVEAAEIYRDNGGYETMKTLFDTLKVLEGEEQS